MQAATLLRAYAAPRDGTILVALSGGADSVALLVSLCEARGAESLAAAHVNHCLRADESDRDEAFCRALCERLGVPLAVARRDVSAERRKGESIEDAARRIRYEELLRAARRLGASAVATAHNANDNAETVLLNLARGAGAAGLAGIPPERALGEGIRVIRPLLDTTRAEIEAFLAERGERFVTDSSNASTDYTRNLIRHEVMPHLLRANARAVEHICAAAKSSRSDEAYLSAEAEKLFLPAKTAETPHSVTLDLPAIIDIPQPLLSRVLKTAFSKVSGAALSRVHIRALLALCRTPDPSAALDLPGGVTARRVYGTLILELSAAESAFELTFTPATAPASERNGGGFDPAKPVYLKPGGYHTRPRRSGDTFSTENWTKSLKKLMIDLKIPAHLRDALPVVVADPDSSVIAALPGFAAAADFAADPGEEAVKVTLARVLR